MHTGQLHATKKPSAVTAGRERSTLQREVMPAGPRGTLGGNGRALQPSLPRSHTPVEMHSKAEVKREKKTRVLQREVVEERGIQDARVKKGGGKES